MKFAVGVTADGTLAGVAVVGRPVARHQDDGRTAEVTRTCTDGTPNANSALYGATWRAARAARALGYRRLITYTEDSESRTSLRAAGFRNAGHLAPHQGWNAPGRRRQSQRKSVGRTRWEVSRARHDGPSGPHHTASAMTGHDTPDTTGWGGKHDQAHIP